MYSWNITPEISSDLERIEELRRTLDRGILPRRWAGRLRRELEAESTAASTSMEGVAVTVEEVRRILAGDIPPSVKPSDARLVEGYRDAMSFVLRRADDPGFVWQTELILGIHDRVMAGSYVSGAGRFREGPVFLAVSGEGRSVYEPPSADLVSVLVNDLADFMQQNSSKAPVPVLAALVHVRLAGIHPFSDGNGRTARVLSSLVMYHEGFTRPQFTSLEEWWGSHRRDYYDAFTCLGARWDDHADVTPFVAAHVRAQRLQVDALSLKEATERVLWDLLEDIAIEELHLQPRFSDALYDAFFGRPVTNRYYRSLADISVATATNDLARLEAAGLLRAVGAGRSRSYEGAERLIAAVANAANLDGFPSASPIEAQRAWVMARLAERVHGS
ncbi:MAG: Fic family protein [Coriobacteriia bacterium]